MTLAPFRLQFGGARHHVVLGARADGERSALRGQRLGDGLSHLTVMADARDDGDLAFEIARHFTLLRVCEFVAARYTVGAGQGA